MAALPSLIPANGAVDRVRLKFARLLNTLVHWNNRPIRFVFTDLEPSLRGRTHHESLKLVSWNRSSHRF